MKTSLLPGVALSFRCTALSATIAPEHRLADSILAISVERRVHQESGRDSRLPQQGVRLLRGHGEGCVAHTGDQYVVRAAPEFRHRGGGWRSPWRRLQMSVPCRSDILAAHYGGQPFPGTDPPDADGFTYPEIKDVRTAAEGVGPRSGTDVGIVDR